MKRRKFFEIIAGFGAMLGAFGLSLFEKIASEPMARAVRTRFFPGKIIPINEEALKKPGKWQG